MRTAQTALQIRKNASIYHVVSSRSRIFEGRVLCFLLPTDVVVRILGMLLATVSFVLMYEVWGNWTYVDDDDCAGMFVEDKSGS